MAGGGTSPFNSSKEFHQQYGDYNDLVIVPKSILIDTADAIRNKKGNVGFVMGDISNGTMTELDGGIKPVNFATTINSISMPTALSTNEATSYGAAGNTGSYNPKYIMSGNNFSQIDLGSYIKNNLGVTWKSLWTTICLTGWWNNTSTGGYKGPCAIILTRKGALDAVSAGRTIFSAETAFSCGSPTSSTYSFGSQLGFPFIGLKITEVLPASEGGNDTMYNTLTLYKRTSATTNTWTQGTNSKFSNNGTTGRYAPVITVRNN